jgi:hypothetical protein
LWRSFRAQIIIAFRPEAAVAFVNLATGYLLFAPSAQMMEFPNSFSDIHEQKVNSVVFDLNSPTRCEIPYNDLV